MLFAPFSTVDPTPTPTSYSVQVLSTEFLSTHY